MKFSIVTISFNQAPYLERAIESVLGQDADVEYIVVDPGSTDGSREIIERYRGRIAKIVFEPDAGPADGLNKGFALATGDILGCLNSDDMLVPGALSTVAGYFGKMPQYDVLCGHAWIVDKEDRRLRRVWSDPFCRLAQAYGTSVQIQPSTFIRAKAFRKTNGYNMTNRRWWDGELMIDLYLSGAKIGVIDEFLSLYRIHPQSITGAGGEHDKVKQMIFYGFSRLMGRSWGSRDWIWRFCWRILRQFRNPAAFFERLRYGPIYGEG